MLGRASSFFSLYFVFFRGAVFEFVSHSVVVCVFSVISPPEGPGQRYYRRCRRGRKYVVDENGGMRPKTG